MNPLQLMQMVTSLQNNPMQFLSGRGFNLPFNMTNPEQIARHLVNSGQVKQNDINQAMQIAGQMGIRL